MRHILITSLLLALAACGRSTPHDQWVEALQVTRSWTATAQMVGEAWQQGSVPDHYAQQTLIKSQREINQEVKGLNTPPAVFQELQQAIQEMTVEVEQHNKAAIAVSLQKISVEQQQLDALAQATGTQP